MRLIVGQRLVECLFTTGGEEEASRSSENCDASSPMIPMFFTLRPRHTRIYGMRPFNGFSKKSADSYRAHQILAEVLETQEKFGEAAAEYRAIIRLQPRMPAFHYKLGKMLLRADPTPQGEAAAMAEFRAELDINPFDVPSHVEIGELELKAGRVEDAYKLFSRAVALQPGHADRATRTGASTYREPSVREGAGSARTGAPPFAAERGGPLSKDARFEEPGPADGSAPGAS